MLILALLFSFSALAYSQEKIYHPEADAKADIQQAVQQASEEHKNIIIQVGGNWCSWCLLFNKFIHEDADVNSLIENNYVYYHLNYSKENKNQDILDSYGNPEKMGFPVLLVLDEKGNLLHTQETSPLEEGKGYNKEKVLNFFQNWLPGQ